MIELTDEERDQEREKFVRAVKLVSGGRLPRGVLKKNISGVFEDADIRHMFDGWELKAMAEKAGI